MATPEILESKIQDALDVDFVKAIDLSDGCGSKFEITCVSKDFIGKPLLQQHRLIHKAIEAERTSIHALTLKTKTPAEWEKISEVCQKEVSESSSEA